MKVEFKRLTCEFPGDYSENLVPGLYLTNNDEVVLVLKDLSCQTKFVINISKTYVYEHHTWISPIKKLNKGDQVIITKE